MERVRQKMEEVIQKQRRMQAQHQAKTEGSRTTDKSQYILALGGVGAGLTIAAIVWLAKSIVTTDHYDLIAPERNEAIHTGEIRRPSDEIVMLNERVVLLTESVSNLEAKLTHIMALTDSITDIGAKHAASSPQQIPESADANSAFDMNESIASRVVDNTPETGKAFAPTHTAISRVNLRPSASLNTTPIAVLNVGTGVEYISKSDGWYYVNTQSNGKGWCSSDYLSPLLPTQRKSPAN